MQKSQFGSLAKSAQRVARESACKAVRLERLEALGFKGVADYEEHQRVMHASRELAKAQLVTVFIWSQA